MVNVGDMKKTKRGSCLPVNVGVEPEGDLVLCQARSTGVCTAIDLASDPGAVSVGGTKKKKKTSLGVPGPLMKIMKIEKCCSVVQMPNVTF